MNARCVHGGRESHLSLKVFVGNLPFKISQESLIKFFESAGKV